MRRATLLLALLVCSPQLARGQTAIEGVLVNGTAPGAGRADRVNLIRLEGGLSQVDAIENVEGKFRFDLDGPGPYLVQALKGGVSYNQMVPPQERGVASVELKVYDTTTDTSALSVSVHWVTIVDGPKLHISRVFQIHNASSPPRSIVGEGLGAGAFRFDVPDAATQVVANVASGRMPIRQDPVETPDRKGKTVAYGIKPGDTRLEVDYELPYGGSAELVETFYHGASELSAVVVPADVTVESPELGAARREQREGVSFWVFNATGLPGGRVVRLKVGGQATAPTPPESAAPAARAGSGGAGGLDGEIKEVSPRTARGAYPYVIIGSSALLLLAALWVALVVRPAPVHPAKEVPRPNLSGRAEALLSELSALDRELAAGHLDAEQHRASREAKKRELHDELQAARRRNPGA